MLEALRQRFEPMDSDADAVKAYIALHTEVMDLDAGAVKDYIARSTGP